MRAGSPKPQVTKRCATCERLYGHNGTWKPAGCVVNSESGVEHAQGWAYDGLTMCGRNATASKWWWPE